MLIKPSYWSIVQWLLYVQLHIEFSKAAMRVKNSLKVTDRLSSRCSPPPSLWGNRLMFWAVRGSATFLEWRTAWKIQTAEAAFYFSQTIGCGTAHHIFTTHWPLLDNYQCCSTRRCDWWDSDPVNMTHFGTFDSFWSFVQQFLKGWAKLKWYKFIK